MNQQSSPHRDILQELGGEPVAFERTDFKHKRCGGTVYKNAILQFWCVACDRYVLEREIQMKDIVQGRARKKTGIISEDAILLRTVQVSTIDEYNRLGNKLLQKRIPSKWVNSWIMVPLENWKQAMWTLKGWEGAHKLAESNPTGRTIRRLSKFPKFVRPAIKEVMHTRRPRIMKKGEIYITPARDGTQVFIGRKPAFVPFDYQDD